MPEYAPQAELAPRDVVARSIVYEMKKTGENNVFLDATHLPPHIITTRFPQIYRFCLEHGVDIIRELVPVAPAAHYMIGGVKVNSWGETNLVGLFAAGEVACTGVHGANRLASNSLLEVLVFSKRIIEKMRKMDKPTTAGSQRVEIQHLLKQRQPTRVVAPPSLSALKQLFWDEVGIIRSRGGLAKTADTLAAWQESLPLPTDRPSYELDNLVLTGRLIAEAALLRQESRGAHFRSDFPQSLPEWQSHIIFTAE
jgi:L-aspartate oxidase